MMDGVDELGIVMWKCKCGKYRYDFQLTCKFCNGHRINAIHDPIANVDSNMKELIESDHRTNNVKNT